MAKKRLNRDAWLQYARAWKSSGLSCAEFASREGLNARTLSWWAWKLRGAGEDVAEGRRSRRDKSGEPQRRPVAFVEVTPMVGTTAASAIELEASGVLVRVGASFKEEQLARVLNVLETRR